MSDDNAGYGAQVIGPGHRVWSHRSQVTGHILSCLPQATAFLGEAANRQLISLGARVPRAILGNQLVCATCLYIEPRADSNTEISARIHM